MRELTDEIVAGHLPPAPAPALPSNVRIPGRHVAEITGHPVVGRARDGLDLDGLLVPPVGRNRGDGPFPLVTLTC